MKKFLALILVLSLSLCCLVACGKKDHKLVVVVDSAVNDSNKVTNTALALVINGKGEIVAARFDSAEVTPSLNEGAVVPVDSVETKVEKGDSYTGMPAGSWEKQTKAFEDAIIGLTADEVANLDTATIAGCTMKSTVPTFKALVAKAFASNLAVSFSAKAKNITLGLAIGTKVSASRTGGASVASDVAATVVVDGKVVACQLDSVEQSFALTDGALVKGTLAVSKNEQGDSYTMPAGSWAKQAQAFANSAVGKTADELKDLETVSDALKAAGCTMQNTTAGYKATIIKAVGYAK